MPHKPAYAVRVDDKCSLLSRRSRPLLNLVTGCPRCAPGHWINRSAIYPKHSASWLRYRCQTRESASAPNSTGPPHRSSCRFALSIHKTDAISIGSATCPPMPNSWGRPRPVPYIQESSSARMSPCQTRRAPSHAGVGRTGCQSSFRDETSKPVPCHVHRTGQLMI
jgi:hypothetical protein